MLWSYSNGSAILEVETVFDSDRQEFVLKIRRADESQHVERFRDEIAFRTRLELLEIELDEQQWQRVGTPTILPGGWKL
jgi:hypothetical protein